MTDLIERLEEWIKFWKVSSQLQPVLETAEKLMREAIAALREQEIHIEDCSKRNETDADRIAELEKDLDGCIKLIASQESYIERME